jgi:hypothetical protein
MTADQYHRPADETAHECPYCERPFSDEQLLALHLGVDHGDSIDDDERAAFEAAHDDESDALRRHRIAAIGLLVLLYFGLLIIYAVV